MNAPDLSLMREDAFPDSGALRGAFFETGATETLLTRNARPRASFSLLDRMWVERGSQADWELLHELHYKGERLPIGPHYWRLALDDETIGVLVTGVPKGLVRERHLVFPKIKPGQDTYATNAWRYTYLNANFRTISRFVVDTMYRGIGCGYRMMNLVSRMEGLTFMEIQSSMSKFNLFGQKAGFRFLKPLNANKHEAGLRFFRNHFESNPQDFEAMVTELRSKSPPEQERLIAACRYFYAKNSALENTGAVKKRGIDRSATMSDRDLIKAIQQVALASPLYGIYRNPDAGRDIPKRLPLTAFDRQRPDEPLVLP